MSTSSKTFGTFIVAALVGLFSFLLGTPKKLSKSKIMPTKTRTQEAVEEKENLFI